jgi:ABC-type multidrug transport system ATPase subunit
MSSLASSLAIDARDVEKTFRSGWPRRRATAALRGVSLAVPRGTIFGLLGPNGAGKTTLLSIFATLLTPDRGSVRVLGLDVAREAAALRRRLNMASGRPSFLWSLRVGEIVAFYGRLYGLSGAASTASSASTSWSRTGASRTTSSRPVSSSAWRSRSRS